MLRYKRWFSVSAVLVTVVACLAGCETASRGYVDTSQDPERYAGYVKQLVLEIVAEAARSSEPADLLLPLVTELGQTDRPREPYASVYDQLLQKSRELRELCGRSPTGRPADLKQRLADLAQLASQLPGEAKPPVMID
ncbi:MAG: hypothetical protein NZ899_04395 [Thermoguttaceae bacterium]|nr:hypothetical protein [Thermoguttaceae bacterium]MDW8077826.1 hypothetical protein [Thermoguttaceae bacterium]